MAAVEPHSRKRFQLTKEQIALSEARKAKKFKLLQQTYEETTSEGVELDQEMNRPWINLQGNLITGHTHQHVKVLTWNVLAQTLVRRQLFPTSNCLKIGQREPMIHREILKQRADILCLQEVDLLDKLAPVLDEAGYTHYYAHGPNKKHGCLIAFSDQYVLTATKVISYDEEEVRENPVERVRHGNSFKTKNIALLVALRNKSNESQGFVVATTHLFWHPKYTYERARQAGLLLRGVIGFRSSLCVKEWPCIISGDFNFPPNDPAYSLLVGDPLRPDQEELLAFSRVVHVSVDASVPRVTMDSNEEGESDPDRVITSARLATSEDGLLSTPELVALFSRASRLRSAYDEGLSLYRKDSDNELRTYGDRVRLSPERHGMNEPEYTSYTHYWKSVLDYIFILDPAYRQANIAGILLPLREADLIPGLPQKGICGSDHIPLVAEVAWE